MVHGLSAETVICCEYEEADAGTGLVLKVNPGSAALSSFLQETANIGSDKIAANTTECMNLWKVTYYSAYLIEMLTIRI